MGTLTSTAAKELEQRLSNFMQRLEGIAMEVWKSVVQGTAKSQSAPPVSELRVHWNGQRLEVGWVAWGDKPGSDRRLEERRQQFVERFEMRINAEFAELAIL